MLEPESVENCIAEWTQMALPLRTLRVCGEFPLHLKTLIFNVAWHALSHIGASCFGRAQVSSLI